MAIFDPCQGVAEALAAIANASTDVRAVTGRATGNLRPWDDPFEAGPMPVLACGPAMTGPGGWDAAMGAETVDVDVDAFSATSAAEANTLAAAMAASVTAVALRTVPTTPYHAHIRSVARVGATRDSGEQLWRASVRLSLTATPPPPPSP